MRSPSHHRRPRYHRRRGYALVIFVLLFFCLLALGALVIDLGLARVTQRQMQTAVDSAALEGLRGRDRIDVPEPDRWRRQEAAKFANYVFEQDDTLDGANEADSRWQTLDVVKQTPGIDDRFIDLVEDFAYNRSALSDLPHLNLNEGDAANGDMAAGRYFEPPPTESHRELANYDRNDFEYGDSNTAFIVRLRRTGETSADGISSIGPRLPYLFGRGSLMARPLVGTQVERGPGIAVRATAIAARVIAKQVGASFVDSASSRVLVPGALPIAIHGDTPEDADDLGSWEGLSANDTAISIDASTGILANAGNAVGFIWHASTPATGTQIGQLTAAQPLLGSTTSNMFVSLMLTTAQDTAPASQRRFGYVPILAETASTLSNRVIGFGWVEIAPDPTDAERFLLKKIVEKIAPANASATIGDGIDIELNDEEWNSLISFHRHFGREFPAESGLTQGLFAPALVR